MGEYQVRIWKKSNRNEIFLSKGIASKLKVKVNDSLYLFMVLLTGTCFYPTGFQYFINQYRRGKTAHQFHQLDFLKMLHFEISLIQNTFNIQ